MLRKMVRALQLPEGSQGLDAGCGMGLQCLLLAEEIGFTGHVTGLDISPKMLDHARKIVNDAGLSEKISFHEGDVTNIPFKNNTFDWVWSVDCAGYGTGEPLLSLKELARVVKPGGFVAIAAWSSEKLLPGYPQLEARLEATSDGIAPFRHGNNPEWHFLRTLGWLKELGFRELRAQVFADSVFAPLNDEIRNGLVALLNMRWPNVASELTSDDFAEFQRLCLPDSPNFILNLPDYYAFFTYSMFVGKKDSNYTF